jgi:hypothetical protein
MPLLKGVLWFGQRYGDKSHTFGHRRLVRMRVIALARWTLLPGPNWPRYLLFETNWSGAQQSYIPDLAMLMRLQWKAIWGNTKNFPGPVPTTKLLEHVDEVDWGTDHYWTDYDGNASTQMVLRALEFQTSLTRFIEHTKGMSADRFADKWGSFITEVQHRERRSLYRRAEELVHGSAASPMDMEVTILTPVRYGKAGLLRKLLRGLSRGSGEKNSVSSGSGVESPFARLSGTHFARLVVIDIPSPHLLFSTRFDREAKGYLSRLAKTDAAQQIWGHCTRPGRDDPDKLDPDTLLKYLRDESSDRLCASYVISAFDRTTTVAQINSALTLHSTVSKFAATTDALDASELAHGFRQLKEIRELARL